MADLESIMRRIFNFTFILAPIALVLVSLAGYWGKLHLCLELAAHFCD